MDFGFKILNLTYIETRKVVIGYYVLVQHDGGFENLI